MQNQDINVGLSPVMNMCSDSALVCIANISIGDDYKVFKKLSEMRVDFVKDGDSTRSIIRNK